MRNWSLFGLGWLCLRLLLVQLSWFLALALVLPWNLYFLFTAPLTLYCCNSFSFFFLRCNCVAWMSRCIGILIFACLLIAIWLWVQQRFFIWLSLFRSLLLLPFCYILQKPLVFRVLWVGELLNSALKGSGLWENRLLYPYNLLLFLLFLLILFWLFVFICLL